MPRRALLNDVSPHLISFYRYLQRGLTPTLPMANDERLYYAYRSQFNDLIRSGRHTSTQAAELFYYLNRTGYNGLCRFNRSGEYNVPFGRYSTIRYLVDFTPYQTTLKGWTFSCDDFSAVGLDSADFIYADPPYDVEFTQYAQNGFTWVDQVRLAEGLAEHAGPVVLVNQATPRVTALYRKLKFRLRFLDAPRRINCTGDRTPAREILATRNL
jgi:DNA adenine methylase